MIWVLFRRLLGRQVFIMKQMHQCKVSAVTYDGEIITFYVGPVLNTKLEVEYSARYIFTEYLKEAIVLPITDSRIFKIADLEDISIEDQQVGMRFTRWTALGIPVTNWVQVAIDGTADCYMSGS